MKFRLHICALALLVACESTPNKDGPLRAGEEITISADELEPVARFFLETNRVLAAEFIRVEMTPQFFESKMGFTRDPRFVERTEWRDKNGNRIIQLKNINRSQKTNVDPKLLPRVYFGAGLTLMAHDTIRIKLTAPKDRRRPLFINITGKNSTGDAKLWVSGRLQQERPTLSINLALIWSDQRERYVPKSHIG